MASFPAQTAKFSSNYVMIYPTFVGVVLLRTTIKAPVSLATSPFRAVGSNFEVVRPSGRVRLCLLVVFNVITPVTVNILCW